MLYYYEITSTKNISNPKKVGYASFEQLNAILPKEVYIKLIGDEAPVLDYNYDGINYLVKKVVAS